MLNQESAQAIVDRYLSALVEGDLESVLALYATDAVVEDPVGSEPIVGKAALTEFYSKAVDMVVEAHCQGPVRTAGHEIAFSFEIEAVFEGQRSKIEIIDHFVLNAEQKIQSMRAFWSEANMSQCSQNQYPDL